MKLVQFTHMVREFLRRRYRDWLAGRVVANGEALDRLYRQRGEYLFAGVQDEQIDDEIKRRERRAETLLTNLKEAH